MRELLLDLPHGSGRRAALEHALRSAIRNGRLPHGMQLPSSRVLAADIAVSRSTVVAAYEQLTAEGYLVAQPGSATRVADYAATTHMPDGPNPIGPERRWDWRPGQPDVSAFPRNEWIRSFRHVVSTSADHAFAYPDPRGAIELRTVLADYLGRTRTVHAAPSSIRIGSGITATLRLIAQTLRRLGISRIGVEDPMFLLHAFQLRDVGLELVPVRVDDDGLCVDHLANLDLRAVLVTPANQYPLGVTMTAHRRSELASWARSVDGWIIEDDYDGEFRYDKRPIGSLQGLAPDRVIYTGTSSKSLSPTLRLSWAALPEGLLSDFDGIANFFATVPGLDQLVTADFIARGALDRQIRIMRKRYLRRRNDVRDALRSTCAWLEVPDATAGLHLTTRFADAGGAESARDREAPILRRAATESVGLFGLATDHWGRRDLAGFVIGFSRPAEHEFPQALERLIDVVTGSEQRSPAAHIGH